MNKELPDEGPGRMTGWLQLLQDGASNLVARCLARIFYFSQHVLKCTLVVPKSDSSTVSNRELVDSYSNTFYWIMLQDLPRMSAYRSALSDRQLCSAKRFVEIGTGARMPLAVIAAQHGAEHVDAIEGNQRTVQRATRFHARLPSSTKQKIRLHSGLSTDIQLDQRCDALIHEIIGTVASSDGMIHCLADAQKRLLTPNASIIPSRVSTVLVPVEKPPIRPRSAIASWIALGETKLDRHAGIQLVYNTSKRIRLSENPVTIEAFDCGRNAPPLDDQAVQVTNTSIALERDGRFSGFLLACHVVTAEGAPVIDALNQITNWGQAYAQMSPEPIPVKRGDTIRVRFSVDAREITPSYRLEVVLEDPRREFAIAWKGTESAIL